MKLLLAADLHYSKNLAGEMEANRGRIPDDTYDHCVEGTLYWHNRMMVEAGEQQIEGIDRMVRQESPDLVVFMGDLVNTNWHENVAAIAQLVRTLPCPVRLVTGNHDLYLGDPACRLQDAIVPGEYATGLRHELVDDMGIVYLDLFVEGAGGEYRKWMDPHAGERVNYRPEDIHGALARMASMPQTPWLVLGHFPMCAPESRIDAPGRKMGRRWAGGAPVAAHLDQPDNLQGIICGHQHFVHYQPFSHGFHWTLPGLVEYPCALGVVEWNGAEVTGRIQTVSSELASTSLQARQQQWTNGEATDRRFIWRAN